MDTENGYPIFADEDRDLFQIEDARSRSFDRIHGPKPCRKSPTSTVAVLALTLVGTSMSIAADAPKFVPPKGKTLVAIGGSGE